MSAIDELRLPLDDEIFLAQAVVWLSEGERPLPGNYALTFGIPTVPSQLTDPTALEALWIALCEEKIKASAYQMRTICPPDYEEGYGAVTSEEGLIHLTGGSWHSLGDVNWSQNSMIDTQDGNVRYELITVRTSDVLSSFPSLEKRERELFGDVGEKEKTRGTRPRHRPRDARDFAIEAIKQIYPNGVPQNVKHEALSEEVRQFALKQGRSPPSKDTVVRALREST